MRQSYVFFLNLRTEHSDNEAPSLARTKYRSIVDVVRQSPVANLATLLVIVAVAFVRAGATAFGAEAIPDTAAFLGRHVAAFQAAFPSLGAVMAAAAFFVSGWWLGQVVRVRELYFVRTTVTIPFYGFVACGIFISHDSLTAALASMLLVVAMRSFYSSFRDGYGFSPLFFASFSLGAIPLLYAPALPLAALMPLAVLLFKRSAREALVAAVGLLLPAAAACYVTWGLGGEFLSPLFETWNALMLPSGYRLFGHISVGSGLLFAYLLALVLSAIFFCCVNLYSLGSRARYITVYNMCAFVVSLAVPAMPGATPGALALVAVPAALMIPAMLVRLHKNVSTMIYAVLILICAVHIFIA